MNTLLDFTEEDGTWDVTNRCGNYSASIHYWWESIRYVTKFHELTSMVSEEGRCRGFFVFFLLMVFPDQS